MIVKLHIYETFYPARTPTVLRESLEVGLDYIPRVGERLVLEKIEDNGEPGIELNGIVKTVTHIFNPERERHSINISVKQGE